MPRLLLAHSYASASVVTNVLLMKYVDAMPLYRQEQSNRSIIPRYRTVVIPSTHTAENHDFISSDQGSKSSTSKSLFRSARSGNMLSK